MTGSTASSISLSWTSSGGGGDSPGSFAVAPCVDMTNNFEPMLNEAATQAGLKAFSAAFVIGSGCTRSGATHCRSPAIPP